MFVGRQVVAGGIAPPGRFAIRVPVRNVEGEVPVRRVRRPGDGPGPPDVGTLLTFGEIVDGHETELVFNTLAAQDTMRRQSFLLPGRAREVSRARCIDVRDRARETGVAVARQRRMALRKRD